MHHWTYEHLGAERPDELVVLCPQHHQAAHRGTLRRNGTAGTVAEDLVAGCLSGGRPGEPWAVACPTCGSRRSAVRRVFTRRGWDWDRSTIYDGTAADGVEWAPGSTLVVVMDCGGDCGRPWELRLADYAGQNRIEAIPIRGDA